MLVDGGGYTGRARPCLVRRAIQVRNPCPQGEAMSISVTPAADAEQAIGTIMLAFAADPMARWSFPEPGRYLAQFPAIVRGLGGRAFAQGTAYHLDGFAGAALWLPPGVGPDEEALVATVERTVPAERQPEMFAVFEQMEHFHPREPHWFLPLIGVDPRLQGKGHGSALLAHTLARCDQDHLPAYLESSNLANVPLYERHGFRAIGKIQVGSSPPLIPMLRPAR
jgi:GNAT superfamily N-acetyltransferase